MMSEAVVVAVFPVLSVVLMPEASSQFARRKKRKMQRSCLRGSNDSVSSGEGVQEVDARDFVKLLDRNWQNVGRPGCVGPRSPGQLDASLPCLVLLSASPLLGSHLLISNSNKPQTAHTKSDRKRQDAMRAKFRKPF